MPIAVGHHLFANEVDRKKAEQAWRSWLDGLFATEAEHPLGASRTGVGNDGP